MPANLLTIIEKSKKIKELFSKYGFENPRLFKGCSKDEEKNFNLIVDDALDNNDEAEFQTLQVMKFDFELSNLLDCTINVCTRDNVIPGFLEKIDNNSVKLSLDTDSLIVTRQILEKYFGANWMFNPVDNLKYTEIAKSLENEPSQNGFSNNKKFFL